MPSMGQAEFNARTDASAEISAFAVRAEPDSEPVSEKQGTAETDAETGAGGTEVPAERNGDDDVGRTPKKSLSFKLAFIGLAASMFVFQVDATALGIALPVSNTTFSHRELNCPRTDLAGRPSLRISRARVWSPSGRTCPTPSVASSCNRCGPVSPPRSVGNRLSTYPWRCSSSDPSSLPWPRI